MKKLTLLEVKQALWDNRFRQLFPEHEKEIKEFLNNPTCACNISLYRKLMTHKDKLQQYFPTREIVTPQEEFDQLSQNHWKVINCSVGELQDKLRRLGRGRKQVAVARWQDQVTVVINELDYVF